MPERRWGPWIDACAATCCWEERTLTIGEDAYNVLKISNGMAAVVEANCGDHTCIRTGAISREGETIVCLPHRMVVRVEGGEGAPFDAAVR